MQPNNDQNNSQGQSRDFSKSALSAAEVFAQDQFGLFVYKKTEKLTSALYMITGLVKDSEPLKWAIRDSALELLAAGLSFAGANPGDRNLFGKDLSSAMLRTLSMLEVGARSRIISDMNCAIMRREFEMLLKDIRTDEAGAPGALILSETFFSVPRASETPRKEIALPFSDTTAAPAKKPEAENKGHEITSQPKQALSDKEPSFNTKPATPAERRAPALSAPRIKDKNRQELIVATLRKYKNRKLSIKDFAQVITGCSEKTIQRELLELVEKGVLKKEGERRWSTYYLGGE